jgi:predicted Zn-dependent protease
VAVVLAFLALAAARMTAFGGFATATLDGGTPEPVRIVEVGPGDTLYGIAGDIAEPGKIREMVHHIEQLNALPSAQITVGQRLAVPVK